MLADPNKIAGIGDVHIGTDCDPHNDLIVSQTGAPSGSPAVLEPDSLALLGTGPLGLAGLRRRFCVSWHGNLNPEKVSTTRMDLSATPDPAP
jgi:hypothetical protein